jgi:hypothetical protein
MSADKPLHLRLEERSRVPPQADMPRLVDALSEGEAAYTVVLLGHQAAPRLGPAH